MGRLTESIVEFLTGEALASPPAQAVGMAVDGFTDCIGVMIAGSGEPVSRHLASYALARNGGGPSRLLLGPERVHPSLAALVGAGAAHALDYDDYAFGNHVSALLVPALIAEAERSGASGAELLAAYLAGFEVWGEVYGREPAHLHSRGWHPTGVFGALGVTAALCRLRGLDAAACRNALGLAVTNGAGVMDNFGTEAKPYQGARAAEAGVVCVELALAGVDAGPHALDGTGGLLAALSPADEVDRESPADRLGHAWLAVRDGLNIKPHPTVGASQRCIDAAIQLHRDHRPAVEGIERVVARVSEKHAAVMRFHRPRTASEARFSLQFGVAAGLLTGRVGLAELSGDYLGRDDLQRLMARVEIEAGPDDDPEFPVGAAFDTVHVFLADGARLDSEPVQRYLGHARNPMDESQLRAKFGQCVEPVIGPAAGQGLFEALRDLPRLASVAELPTLPINPR